MSVSNLEINVLFSLVLCKNNRWYNSQNQRTGQFAGSFVPCNFLVPLDRAIDKSRALEGRVVGLLN